MKKSRTAKRSPRAAEWLLKTIHSDRGKYTHLGDFNEIYNQIASCRHPALASSWYWLQVFRSLPGFFSNKIYWSVTMFRNYLLISFRNILKNKWFSLINIAGLAVGMACFILILAFVQFELSFDRFHDRADRIFRVISRDTGRQGWASQFVDHSPEHLAQLLKAEFPEVVRATRTRDIWTDKAILKYGDKTYYQKGLFADTEFLEVFSYPLLKGDKTRALAPPNAIVLTHAVAGKLFPGEDPIGRTLEYRVTNRTCELNVTGVLEDPPKNSHLQFEFLVSVATTVADKRDAYMVHNWNVWNFTTYIELQEAGDQGAVEGKFPAFLIRQGQGPPENGSTGAGHNYEFRLQPIRDIHLRSNISGELATNNQIRYVTLFMSIAVIVLLIACINYMNLVTARATARAKEIGIRKVAGAGRGQLLQQFIGETLLLAFLALGLALILVFSALPSFRTLIGSEFDLSAVSNTPLHLMILGTVLIVGVASGIYPALVLSAFRPVNALKDFGTSGRRGSRLRNGLVVLQFSASIILIIATLVVFRQLNFIRNQRLGYDRENVVVLPVREPETRDKAQIIKTELLSHPEVLGVSVSGGLPTNIRSRYIGVEFQRDNGESVKMELCYDYVDHDFLDVFRIELAQGRNFSREFGDDPKGVLLNETAVRQLGWSDPIGKKVDVGRDHHVVGVIKDFYFASFHRQIEPMALTLGTGSNIAVRLTPGDPAQRLALLKRVFENNTTSQPFDFFFLDDAFNRLYQKEQRTGQLFGYFSLLAVFIACLGLLGLSSYTVDRRTKEIGIRKVLGASAPSIVRILTGEFVRLVLISNLIAWPVAFLAMRLWLQDFAYRIALGWQVFALSAAAALLIACVTIGSQTLKAAMTDPVITLRYE